MLLQCERDLRGRPMKTVRFAALVLLLTSCKVRHFECETQPSAGNTERGCLPSHAKPEAMCRAGCFSQDMAYCFFSSRSAIDMAVRGAPLSAGQRWSPSEVNQNCCPTLAECASWRMAVGTGTNVQPPVKSECLAVTAKEATKDP